jgi:hypothetical protein
VQPRQLGEGLDVRKSECGPVCGKDRLFIKGLRCTLLSNREILTLGGRKSLALLLAANKRLNTAYVFMESFAQLRGYSREGWAGRFVENWRGAPKWQGLKRYERFPRMIDRHGDGIAAHCAVEKLCGSLCGLHSLASAKTLSSQLPNLGWSLLRPGALMVGGAGRLRRPPRRDSSRSREESRDRARSDWCGCRDGTSGTRRGSAIAMPCLAKSRRYRPAWRRK